MSQQPTGLLGIGAYVPERVMTNEEWTEWVDTSDEWITTRTGIKTRRVAAEDESTVDLGLAAARVALADAGLEPTQIDEIIVATDTPEVYAPDTAAYIQERLGAREVPAYDLAGSGCAGWLLGLDLARSRIGDDRRILVIAVELITRLMNWRDRNTCVLFGDAAGAAVVGRAAGAMEILAATAGTDGSKAGILGREVGGTRKPFTPERAANGEYLEVVMRGREVFKEAVQRMTAAAREVLSAAGVDAGDLALVVPHQANLRILQAVQKALDVPPEKVFINVSEYGNTGSASVPLALWEARRNGRCAAGDLVLLTAFGAGFHWAATLLRVGDG
jgi:3-oxoacyl-[acyl-carrier-protein] synthase-3